MAEVRTRVQCFSMASQDHSPADLPQPELSTVTEAHVEILSMCSTRSDSKGSGVHLRRLASLIGSKSLLTAERNYPGGNNQPTKRQKGGQVNKETPKHHSSCL